VILLVDSVSLQVLVFNEDCIQIFVFQLQILIKDEKQMKWTTWLTFSSCMIFTREDLESIGTAWMVVERRTFPVVWLTLTSWTTVESMGLVLEAFLETFSAYVSLVGGDPNAAFVSLI